jgi:hypothetical protein
MVQASLQSMFNRVIHVNVLLSVLGRESSTSELSVLRQKDTRGLGSGIDQIQAVGIRKRLNSVAQALASVGSRHDNDWVVTSHDRCHLVSFRSRWHGALSDEPCFLHR